MLPLSQAARMTLVVPLQLAFNRVLDPATATTATVMVMLATSGLCEETTRWVVLRFAWRNQLPPFDDIPQLSELCAALICHAAKVQSVATKPSEAITNEKYVMRSLLYCLGLGGKDHKQVRQLLLGRLDGNSAWKTPV